MPRALSGSGTSPRSVQIRASRAPGSSSSSPSSRHRSTAHGLRATNESGPLSSSRSPTVARPQPAADDGLGLQHGDVERGIGLEQPMGRGQARDPAAHDHDLHACVTRRGREPLADDVGEHADERRVGVRHLGADETHPGLLGDRLRLDVEVVQDLEVVGDEPGRTHDHRRAPSDASSAITSSIGGPHQGSSVRPALCHAIVVPIAGRARPRPGPRSRQPVAVPARVLARVAPQAPQRSVLEGRGSGRLCAEKTTVAPSALLGREPAERSATRAARNATNAGWSWYARTKSNAGGPSPDRARGRARRRSRPTSPTSAAPSRSRCARSIPSSRIRSTPSAMNGGECFIPRYARKRRPRRAFSSRSSPSACAPRDVEQGEAVADRRVALPQLLEVLGRGRPAAADVGVVALDVVGAARGAVRHHEHADRWSRSLEPSVLVDEVDESLRFSTGVAGSTP